MPWHGAPENAEITFLMNSTVPPPSRGAPLGQPSNGRALHLVDFFCHAPEAKQVSLIGDFNGWQPAAHPMKRMSDGGWYLRLELPHGHHQYLFLVDGKPMLDPNAMGKVHNERNETVSLIAIS
jgi:1,4-alpha-glucan branching enzyme